MLPKKITEDEKLARIVCGNSKLKDNRKRFGKYEDGSYFVKGSLFIEDRTPMELSVNRISSLSLEQVHILGEDHRKLQPTKTYWGFAEIAAEDCFFHNCRIEKDDYQGEKPYHANLIYPNNEMEDILAIADQLAFKAKFILSPSFE